MSQRAPNAVLWPSCLGSYVPDIERLGQHEYRQFVAGSSLRGQDPQVLARMALRAAAQGEYYKALYLSRIALDYDQFSAELWQNHASFAEQVALADEARQARHNAGVRQNQMQPLAPSLWAGGGARPATLADWVALASLIADDVVARSDGVSRLVVIARGTQSVVGATGRAGYRLEPGTLGEILAGLEVTDAVRRGETGAGPVSWSYVVRAAPGASPEQRAPLRAGDGWNGVPVPVLWASGSSRAAFVTAYVAHLPGTPPLVQLTTLGAQASGQAPVSAPTDLTGRALAVPRLATLCASAGGPCTPPLLPLEVLLSDEDFEDVGLASAREARASIRDVLGKLSEAYLADQPIVMAAGNADATRLPAVLVGIDGAGSCLGVELQPEVWLAPSP